MIALWLGFAVVVGALLVLDLFVVHRDSHVVEMREAAWWTGFYIAIGLAFTAVVYLIYEYGWFGAELSSHGVIIERAGGEAAAEYLTAYVLEKSLSVDNIFVIAVLMEWFQVPEARRHRVLFWGILGAIAARVILIVAGIWLLSRFAWVFYVFGAVLLVTGVRMMRPEHEPLDPETSWIIALVRRALPISMGDHGDRFTVRVDGRRAFTRLALALVTIEVTDLLFAVDSIPAVLGVSTDPFIVVTSNVFAILGLRALFFVLAAMMSRFRHLQLSLAILLCLIAAKMLLHDVYAVPTWASLAAAAAILGAGVLASVWSARRAEP